MQSRTSSQQLFGRFNPDNLRDTFYLIEHRRETAHVLDQANENNSVSSSGDTARIRAAYEPLFDFPGTMNERDRNRDWDAYEQPPESEEEEEGGNSYYYNPE